MDALTGLAENILSTVDGIGAVVSTILEVNYLLAATIVHLVSETTFALSALAFLFYDFLVSALEDFQFFLTEVFGCLYYLVRFGVRIIDGTFGWVVGGVSGVGFALGTVGTEVVSAFFSLGRLFGALAKTIVYVAKVFVDALLVLLQCIPYGLVFLVQCILGGLQWAVDSARNFSWRTKNGVVRGAFAVVDAVHKIPLDAYIGLVMTVAMCVLYRKTPLGYYMSPVKLARMARKVFRSTTRAATGLILRRIPSSGGRLVRCTMGCFSYFFEVLRSWLTMDGGFDDDDEYPDPAQSHPNSLDEATSSSHGGGGDKLTTEELAQLRKELEQQKERNLCIICQDRPKSVILLPCRHLCLCEDCCSELLDRRSTCPLCRTVILSPIQVFV